MTTNPLPPIEVLKGEQVDRDAAADYILLESNVRESDVRKMRQGMRDEPASGDVEARAREVLIDIDKLLGKPIVTGPIAEQAYRMILAALQASPAPQASDQVTVSASDLAAVLEMAGGTDQEWRDLTPERRYEMAAARDRLAAMKGSEG